MCTRSPSIDDVFVKKMYDQIRKDAVQWGFTVPNNDHPDETDVETVAKDILLTQFREQFGYVFEYNSTRPSGMVEGGKAKGTYGFETFSNGSLNGLELYIRVDLPNQVSAPTWLSEDVMGPITDAAMEAMTSKTLSWRSAPFSHTSSISASKVAKGDPIEIQIDGIILFYNNEITQDGQDVAYNVISFVGVWYPTKVKV